MDQQQSPFNFRRELGSFLIASLKGISQVLLIENAITGLFILLAISTSSLVLGIVTILAACIGTLIGIVGGATKELIHQGLLSYNSVLTAIALTLFLDGPYNWLIALIGAAIATLFTAAMIHVMRDSGIPILTFPFIVLTWLTLLATYKLKSFRLTPKLVPQDLTHWELDIAGDVNWIEGMFNGIGQIFFLHNTPSGILLFIGVFLAGWRFGVYAVVGNLIALLTSIWLGGEYSLIFNGLYGYNAILTVFAVSLVFSHARNGWAIIAGIIGAAISVPLTASIATFLLPFGLPALTMPFVLSTWLLLGARKIFPHF